MAASKNTEELSTAVAGEKKKKRGRETEKEGGKG